jgi:hypothetical protein
MRPVFLAFGVLLGISSAHAEGPATGPSDQAGCANLPAKEQKPGTTDRKNQQAANPAPAKPDCSAKQKRAEEPKPATTK